MTSRHYSDDDLVLFFYGEGRRQQVQGHLDACAECAARYGELAATLRMVAAPAVPDRGERYGLEVWQRIRPILPSRPPVRAAAWWANRLVLGGAMAAIVVLAFLVGRSWEDRPRANEAVVSNAPPAPDTAAMVRMAAIGDHLERSERLLLDFVNAGGATVDVSGAQTLASDLIVANRLYREAAEAAGDNLTADVLDALERSLIEITHGPSTLAPAEFDATRVRLDAAALLFKVRVLADELHERELTTLPSRKDA